MKRVCLYGRTCALFVEAPIRRLQRAFADCGEVLTPVTLEDAVAEMWRWRDVESLYVFPFEVPRSLPPTLPADSESLVAKLFPMARIENSMAIHRLCFDKIETSRRLLARGVPLPDTLITNEPAELRSFVEEHQQVILKEPRSCGGHGHLILTLNDEGNVAGAANQRQYLVELRDDVAGRRVSAGVLTLGPPFFAQRLVADVRKDGALSPAQVLRAYIVGGQVMFWTERYRLRVQHPSDFIINATFGARYRMLRTVSEEAYKIAMRAAEVIGMRIGVVDLVRTGSQGPFVLELDTDGEFTMIDRSFQDLPEWRSVFDFDRYIAEDLTAQVEEVSVRVQR